MSHHPHPSPHHHQQQQQQQHGLIRNGAAAGQNGTPRQNESPLQSVLRSGTCILSGGRDRQGGAILTFPRNSPALEKVRLDDLGILLDHLTSIPSEEVRRHGFTIIIDMRDHGSRWNNVKDILRGLQERFTQSIRTILIVKPDSFTHKPNLSKYGSEILLISVDQLTKYLNVSELTTDLGGTLHYDHREWLSLRSKVQEFTTFTADVLKKMDQHKQAMLHHGELANDLPAVEALIVRHHVLREELDMYPVEKLSERGKQILAAVDPRSAGDMRLGPNTAARPNIGIANNPDLQAALSRLRLQVERLDGIRGLLHKAWQIRLDNLEQCKHLRSFEQQAEQMLGWINFNRKKFLATYTDIGISSASVKTLEQLHKPFHLECSETFHVIERVIDLGNKMKANHHYASPAIGSITTKLRDERDAFRVGLEDRGKILDLSAVFHRKVEEFKAKSPGWAAACEATWSPLDSGSLEAVQRNHEEMTKSMAQLYSEICFDGSSLLKTMHGSGEVISGDSETARAEFTRAGHYIRDLVTAVQKEHAYLITLCKKTKGALEDQWALRLYQEELRQVIRWIQKDADPFLASNREIGQNLADANKHRAVHAAFEKNAKNTYSNADQLLEASHVLMEKQGFNVEDVQISAEQLHRCVTEFRGKVQARHKMLDTACSFFEQVAVLTPLLERANNPPPIEPRVLESLELIIEEVQRLKHEKQAVVETRADAKQVGCKLLQQLVDSSMADSADYQHVYATLGTILQHREQVDETFEQRRRQLEIFQRFRMFERSVMEISEKVAVWSESVQQHSMSGGGERLSADQAAQEYGRVKSRLAELQTLSDQAGNRGQELLELLEGFDPVSTTVDGEPMSCRVNVCLQELADHLGNFAEDAETYRLYLRNILQLHKCNSHGQQILDSMRHLQGVLRNLSLRLVSLEDSRRVLEVYARHQANVEKLHGIVRTFETSAHDIAANDVDAADVAERLRDVISKQWDSLYKLSEDLGRGITTGVKFYHTAEKVCAFLQGLQKEYQYDEDWCSKLRDKAEAMEQMVRKHIKTKDDFMTFCSNLRKTSETFLKFVSRSYTTFTDNKESLHGVDTQINGLLGHIKRLEDDVLALWGHRKKQFDFCLQFISVETSAQKVIKWIEGTGEDYLSTRTSVGNTQAATEALLAEHNDFIRNSKENTEKIGMVMMLAEGLVKNGQNPHAAGIKSCVQAVGEHQRNFLSRMDAYRLQLEIKLGRVSNKVPPPPPEPLTDRNSDGSLDSKLHAMSGSHVSVEEAKKAKQRDGVMSELLSSERSYVKSLSDLIQCFVHEAKTCASGIRPPPGLSAKLPRIFGNIEDIYDFHNEVFLKELEKYEMMPEDCAHCFMTWSPKFDMYVEFCKDQGATAAAVQEPTVVEYFSKVQSFYNLPSTHTIGFYLIMPVQRITRYKELLEKLLKNCVDERGEIREALDLMRNQPKKTNFAMNLDLLDNYDEPLEQLGELILIDAFQVSEPKQRIPKTHQRQVFLFELAILFTKKTDVPGSKDPKFVYKNKLMTAGLGITEDDKESPSFVIWMGRTGTPTSQHSSSGDTKFVLRAPSLDVKQAWIQKLRQVVLDNCVNRSLSVALDIAASRAVGTTAAAAVSGSGVTPRNNCHRNRGSRDSKDYEDSLSLEEASGSTERYSIVSDHSSSTTTDSDKGLYEGDWATVTENYEAVHDGELTVQKGECVEVLERASNKGDFYHVRVRGGATRPSQNAPLNAGSRKLLDGYLPGAVLALVPHNRSSRHLSPSRTMSIDHNGTEDGFNGSSSTSGSTLPVPISISDRALHSGGDDNGGFTDSGAPSQPVAPTTKRRNTFRKWLTNPVRKLSQNRIDTSGGGGTAGGGKHGSSSSGNLAQLPSISVSSNSNKKSASNTVTSPTSPSPTSTASATPPTATTTATSRVKSLFHSHAHPSAPAGPPPSGLPAAASTGASEDVRRASAPPLAVSEVEDPPLAVGRDDDPSRQHHQLAPHHQKPPLQQQQKSSSKNNVIGANDAPPTIITVASSSTRTATDLIHDTAITTTGTMPGLSAAAPSLPEMPPPMEQIQSMSIPGLISNTLLSAAAAGAGGSSPSSAASPEQSLLQQNRLSSSSLPAVAVLDGHITSTAAVAALSIHHIPNARELAGEIENLAITTQSGGRGSSTSSAAMQQHDVDDTANPHKRSNGVTSAGDSGDSTKKSESEERSSTVTSPVLDAGGEDSIGGDADKKPDSFESAEVIPREPTNEENSMSPDPIVRATTMRDYVLRELVDTERDYVKDLGLIIDGYLTYMHDNAMPDDMNGREKLIFGNIQQIYMFHRDTFCGELEKCLEAADRLPQVFIRFERKFQMYVVYCQNKPKSEFIVSEYIDTYFEDIRLKLGQKLKLPDMLIKPVQRVMRYQLMLKDIVKYTERAQLPVRDLQRAIGCIMGVCKLANDFMEVGRLQGFEGNLTAQGKLVLQGSFLVCETFTATAPPPGQGGKDKEKEKEKEKDAPANQKFKERQIFVFEQVVIFSEAVGQSQKKSCYSSPIYVYKSQIQVNKMSLIEVASDTVRFALRSRCPHSGDRMFVCEAPDKEKRDLWVTQIKNMLETQQNFLRALQSPIDFQRRAQQGDEVMTDQFPTPPLFASTTTTVTSPTAPPPPTPPHVGDVSRPPLKFHATDVATADRPSPPAADTRFSKFMRPKSYHVDQETPDRRRIFPRLPDSPGGGGSTGMRGYSGACTTPMPVTPPPVPVEEPSSAANANRRFLFPVPSLKVVHSESDLLKRSTLAGGTDGGRNTSALPAPAELLPASSNSSLLVGAETKSSRRWSISGRRDAKPPPASTTPAALPPKDRFSASFRSKKS